MTKDEFRKLTGEGLLILDGATGSNLQKRGLKTGTCPDKWLLENPEVIIGLQTEYLEAGSRILYSSTFSSNRIKLEEYGLAEELPDMNRRLVGLSKEAIRRFMKQHPEAPECFVAGDISMTGIQIEPTGPMKFEELVEIYREQIRYLAEAGADMIVVETMMSLQETRAGVIAAKEECSLPVMATMTFEADGRSLFGTDPETAIITIQALGADAFGANCSTGPDKMTDVIQKMVRIAKIPVICKPNAGIPSLDAEGNTVYDLSPAEFGNQMERIIDSGAVIIGGCCGTDPDYIREISAKKTEYDKKTEHDVMHNNSSGINAEENLHMLSSERSSLKFTLSDPFMIIGERINPTGKKKLQAELRENSFDMVQEFAEQQEMNGASVLDVNMGMSGADEKTLMLKAISVVTQTTRLPLCIDTSYPEIMEAALRNYPGRALMNSISAESDRCDRMLEVAKKYGAMFILLPLGDSGLPKDLEEKKTNIKKVLDKALAMGLKKEDIIVDGLVGTVGAVKTAGTDTLETIRYCHELGLATVCGLSNISFGLPERINVNTAFLTMAIQSGLTMAICNPNQEQIINAALSADILMNKKNADIKYIEHMNTVKEARESSSGGEPRVMEKEEITPLDAVKNGVLKGNREHILKLTRNALDTGNDASDILNSALIPAINEVGDYFDKGTYFLPQLIASAETMQKSIEMLEPLLAAGGTDDNAPCIVIATVEGDIHDIGKNLVSLMLKNYGFRIIDLGKNISKEEIVGTAMDNNAEIICLSALMTTTMKVMKDVIDYAKEQGCKSKFMIGGAVITDDYRTEIGADGYAADAAGAVKVAKSLVGI